MCKGVHVYGRVISLCVHCGFTLDEIEGNKENEERRREEESRKYRKR